MHSGIPGKTKSEWRDGERKCIQVPGISVPLSGGYRAIIKRKELQRLLIDLQPDVVELSDKTTLSWLPEWCRQNRIPCVLFSHERASDVVSERLPKFLPVKRLFRNWAQNIENHTDAIVCASNYAAQEYSHVSHKVHIVRLGVDHMVFRGSAGQAPDNASPVVLLLADCRLRSVRISSLKRHAICNYRDTTSHFSLLVMAQ